MITGTVTDNEARIRLKVHGPGGRVREIEAIIDTGYTGGLSLPPALVADLRLTWRSLERGILADGSEADFDLYAGEVDWDRQRRRIVVDEIEAPSLVGMALLEGYELTMQVRPHGKVTIKRLP